MKSNWRSFLFLVLLFYPVLYIIWVRRISHHATYTLNVHESATQEPVAAQEHAAPNRTPVYLIDQDSFQPVRDTCSVLPVYEYCEQCWLDEIGSMWNPHQTRQARCALASGWRWRKHTPAGALALQWQLLSTVSARCSPSGFQASCSWVIGSRQSAWQFIEPASAWGSFHVPPRVVFVRADLVKDFVDSLMPCIETPFVLCIGDHDVTVPHQLDTRYSSPTLSDNEWRALLADERIAHIFVNHLDASQRHHKVTPIPLGFNPLEFPSPYDGNYLLQNDLLIGARALHGNTNGDGEGNEEHDYSVLVCDRLRVEAQFDERRRVLALCNDAWRDFCHVQHAAGVKGFQSLVHNHTFVLCTHGGGIEPNPKVFQVLAAGSIPIVERFASAYMYEDANLPVVIVDRFNADALSPAKLKKWVALLAPQFEEAIPRAQVLEKLHFKYWWDKVDRVVKKNHIDRLC